MTPFLKLLRKSTEKLFGTFYDGPTPPKRLEQEVVQFMAMYPKATRTDWGNFAAVLAANSYESGYSRGYEWAERDLDSMPTESPEVEEHHRRHALVWDGHQLLKDFDELDMVVPEDDGEDKIEDSIDEYNRAFERYQRREHPGKRYSR
jgi:hypothetical protein